MIRTAFALLTDLLGCCERRSDPARTSRRRTCSSGSSLASYVERQVRPKRTDNATRVALVLLSRFVAWRELLVIVRPDTLVRWHRDLHRLFWRVKSRPRGRPRIPVELQRLIADMATANRTWGEERIAAELRLKLGLTVSARTVRRYMRRGPRPRAGQPTQSWTTFLLNHAGAVLACDFFLVVTATFQRLYVFVVFDIATRRVAHWNVTEHPRPAGRSSSFEMVFQRMPPIVSSYTIATPSSRRLSMMPCVRCHCRSSGRPCALLNPTLIANASSEPPGASASIG